MTWADLLETEAGLAGGQFELPIIKAAVPFAGTAAFLLVGPRDKGRVGRKEVNTMARLTELYDLHRSYLGM
jgi:hypothetical protein